MFPKHRRDFVSGALGDSSLAWMSPYANAQREEVSRVFQVEPRAEAGISIGQVVEWSVGSEAQRASAERMAQGA